MSHQESKTPRKALLSPRAPVAELVLEERKLRFELFPPKRREAHGGVTATLLDVKPNELEARFKSAKVQKRGAFDEFANKAYLTHPQMRLLWSSQPLKIAHETVIEITEPSHLTAASWRAVAQGLPDPMPATLVCDDAEGHRQRGMGDFVNTHLLLRPLREDVVKMPKEDGAFYLLREPRELAEHHVLVNSASLPISVRVRISRAMLARAAWLKAGLVRSVAGPRVQRALVLDTCKTWDTYVEGGDPDCALKWTTCRVSDCREATLERLGELCSRWLGREADGHIYSRVLQVRGVDSLNADHAAWLFALLQFLVWVVLTHRRMRGYSVELYGASRETQEALLKLTPDTVALSPRLPDNVRRVFAELRKRDPSLLSTMKLVFA